MNDASGTSNELPVSVKKCFDNIYSSISVFLSQRMTVYDYFLLLDEIQLVIPFPVRWFSFYLFATCSPIVNKNTITFSKRNTSNFDVSIARW